MLDHYPNAKDYKHTYFVVLNVFHYRLKSSIHSKNVEEFVLLFAVDPIHFQIAKCVCMETLLAIKILNPAILIEWYNLFVIAVVRINEKANIFES